MILHRGKFKMDIFDVTVHMIICDTPESLAIHLNKNLKKYKEEQMPDTYKGFVFSPQIDPSKIFLYLSKEGLTYNTVGHENDHVRYMILANSNSKDIDIEFSGNIAGYITEKVFQFLNSKNIYCK